MSMPKSQSPLLKDVYVYSKNNYSSSHNSTWYSSIEKLRNILQLKHNITSNKQCTFNRILQECILKKYISDWKSSNETLKEGKLKTYLTLKNNFGLEKYLTLLKYEYRTSITKLRLSAHRLTIEIGRYKNIPRNERICKYCLDNGKFIDDEIHFLINCSKYDTDRNTLFNLISNTVNHFNILTDTEKFIWILNCEDPSILRSVGMFLQTHLP